MRLVGNMWNLNRRMWNSYMQKMNQMNPHSVSTKMYSLAYNQKLVEKKESADNKYNAIPDMKNPLGKVRQDKRTTSLNLINATGSKTKTRFNI